jgi:hypothetical protein
MTHTTVELSKCDVEISPDDIRVLDKEHHELARLSYDEFEEVLAAVAHNEHFNCQ